MIRARIPEALDLVAGELALGLLDGGERLEALRLQLTDPEFAAAVGRWEEFSEMWLSELPDHPLSPHLWNRVAALIAPSQALSERAGSAHEPRHDSGIWRLSAIAAGLLACLFAGLWLSHFGNSALPLAAGNAARPDGRFSVAQIGGAGDPHLATMLYDRDAGTLTIRIAAIAAGPDKAPEVWLINAANPPHSLGFGRAGAATRMQASARLQRSLVGGATLAITLEPVSDHPHAAPSSKILGTGMISTL